MKQLLIFFLGIGFLQAQIKEVKIGQQVWMAENLDVDKFLNGDIIPQAQSNEEWENAGFRKQPAWCYVSYTENNKEQQLTKYKKLYNSFAVNDPRGIVPNGWHISTTANWEDLNEFLKKNKLSLNALMSATDWKHHSGSNTLGLAIQPGGWRDVGCGDIGTSVTFWC